VTLFWSEWVWTQLAREVITVDEAINLMRLERLRRLAGIHSLPGPL
jgi:hypothetical protein